MLQMKVNLQSINILFVKYQFIDYFMFSAWENVAITIHFSCVIDSNFCFVLAETPTVILKHTSL